MAMEHVGMNISESTATVVSQLTRSPMAGVIALFQVIVPAPERPGTWDCLMWAALDKGVVAYLSKRWAGSADEADAAILEHFCQGVDYLNEVDHEGNGWEPMVYAPLDPEILEREISSRVWDSGAVNQLKLSSAGMQTASQYLTEFVDLLHHGALDIWQNLKSNNSSVHLHAAAYNLLHTDSPRFARYRQQAFGIYPWLAAYLYHELPVSWSTPRRPDLSLAFCGNKYWAILSCIDQGRELVAYLARMLGIPASAMRRTAGLYLTVLFNLEHEEFTAILQAICAQPGYKYLTKDGDIALLATHYWMLSLGLRGLGQTSVAQLWPNPARTMRALYGAQRQTLQDLEEQKDKVETQPNSAARDYLESLTDGLVCEYDMGRLKAKRRARRLFAECGPRMLLKASDRWHEKLRRLPGQKPESPETARAWIPIITAPIRLGQRWIVELSDENELWMEGYAMQHCVGSYANQCLHNAVRVFSLMDLDGQRVSTLALCPGNGSGTLEEMFILPMDQIEGFYGVDEAQRQVMLDQFFYESSPAAIQRDFTYRQLEHSAKRNTLPSEACMDAACELRVLVNGSDYLETRGKIFEECVRANATSLSGILEPTMGELALEVMRQLLTRQFQDLELPEFYAYLINE